MKSPAASFLASEKYNLHGSKADTVTRLLGNALVLDFSNNDETKTLETLKEG